ncbi:MAG: DMT family transporter [Nitrospinota bacterium]
MFYAPAALALYSAISFAFSEFAVRVAVRHSSPYTGSLMQAVVHLIIFGLLTLWLYPETEIWNRGAWWYMISGALDPGIGVICYFAGIARVGIARAATVVGTSPLFSAAAAMLLLGERPNVWVWLGTLAIVVGVGALAYEPSVRGKDKLGFVLVILGALFFGLAHTFRKLGLAFIPSSAAGMAVGQVGALIILPLLAPLLPAGSRFNANPKGLAYYFLDSLGIALALFFLFEGLRLGTVSVVVPLMHTFPLIVILVAWIFLREKERITGRLLTGALLIVVGAAAITGLGHG